MNIVGNNNYKNNTFVVDIVKELNVSKLNDCPKIRKNIDMKILVNATPKANTDPEKISHSFFGVSTNFYIRSLLSTRFKPIFSAAE